MEMWSESLCTDSGFLQPARGTQAHLRDAMRSPVESDRVIMKL